MRDVVPGILWLGHAHDARDLPRLLDLGIEAILDLAIEETPPKLTRELVYCRFPLNDGAGNPPLILRAAVETVHSFLARGVPTFVYCGAGMSRSPCIVAAAVALHNNADPDQTLQELIAGQPHDVSPPLWADVKEVCKVLKAN
jgi:protein-tyrosine phosphatase